MNMKQLILAICLLFTGAVCAQDKTSLKDIDKLTFFGVDFSLAKVYGAEESTQQFKDAFTAINNLFLREAKKYNTEKAFKADVTTNITPSLNAVETISQSSLMAEDNAYTLSDEEIARHIKNFDTRDAQGYGAVLIAGLLNKSKAKGTYAVVVFDIATKKIIECRQFTESAQGFGLRNYWARSVYNTLGQIKKKM